MNWVKVIQIICLDPFQIQLVSILTILVRNLLMRTFTSLFWYEISIYLILSKASHILFAYWNYVVSNNHLVQYWCKEPFKGDWPNLFYRRVNTANNLSSSFPMILASNSTVVAWCCHKWYIIRIIVFSKSCGYES